MFAEDFIGNNHGVATLLFGQETLPIRGEALIVRGRSLVHKRGVTFLVEQRRGRFWLGRP
jgi:hypothetical protein